MIITIEGADRSGKSTQAGMLLEWLEGNGYKSKLFKFPDYSTACGANIAERLRSGSTNPKKLHTLMAENRHERRAEILQAIYETHVIVMDRYCESNIVYGMANGLDRKWLESLDQQMPKSDAVILLDTDAARSQSRRMHGDTFESDTALMRRVTDGYRREAMQNGWHIVPDGLDINLAHKAVVGCAKRVMSETEDASGGP